MELLQLLQSQIDALRAKPDAVDVGAILDACSLAYTLARDGLDRSQSAARVPELERLLATANSELAKASRELSEAQKALESAKADRATIEPVLADIREKLAGKIMLCDFEPQLRASYLARCASDSPSELLLLQAAVHQQFNSQWNQQAKPVALGSRGEFVNTSLYKTGG